MSADHFQVQLQFWLDRVDSNTVDYFAIPVICRKSNRVDFFLHFFLFSRKLRVYLKNDVILLCFFGGLFRRHCDGGASWTSWASSCIPNSQNLWIKGPSSSFSRKSSAIVISSSFLCHFFVFFEINFNFAIEVFLLQNRIQPCLFEHIRRHALENINCLIN